MNARPEEQSPAATPEVPQVAEGSAERWLRLHAGRAWYQVRDDVCDNPMFKLAHRALLLHSCTRYEDNRDGGLIKASVEKLARAAGMTPRTARTTIRRLEQMGALEPVVVGGGRHQVNAWRVRWQAIAHDAAVWRRRQAQKDAATKAEKIAGLGKAEKVSGFQSHGTQNAEAKTGNPENVAGNPEAVSAHQVSNHMEDHRKEKEKELPAAPAAGSLFSWKPPTTLQTVATAERTEEGRP